MEVSATPLNQKYLNMVLQLRQRTIPQRGGGVGGGKELTDRGIPSKKSWYVDILNKPWFLLRFLHSGLRVIKEHNLRF